MVVKGVVSTAENGQFRVAVNGIISAPFPRIKTVEGIDCKDVKISVGDTVIVALFSQSLIDGIVLGKA